MSARLASTPAHASDQSARGSATLAPGCAFANRASAAGSSPLPGESQNPMVSSAAAALTATSAAQAVARMRRAKGRSASPARVSRAVVLPAEQRRVKAALKRGDLLAERGLGDEQLLSGASEVPVLGYSHKVLKVPKVPHRAPPSAPGMWPVYKRGVSPARLTADPRSRPMRRSSLAAAMPFGYGKSYWSHQPRGG
jgi:hypothetical protein